MLCIKIVIVPFDLTTFDLTTNTLLCYLIIRVLNSLTFFAMEPPLWISLHFVSLVMLILDFLKVIVILDSIVVCIDKNFSSELSIKMFLVMGIYRVL